jgi:aminomethyltransferase
MVDFGGWEMPLHYGSQLEEHQAVRAGSGVFDVSHMRVVDLGGTGSLDFLRLLLANDCARLPPGKALYSCMLQADGGVLDDLIVYRLGASDAVPYRLVVNAATADADIAWMQRVAAERGCAVELHPRTELALLAVQGPQARVRLAQAAPRLAHAVSALPVFGAATVDDWFVGRTGYTGEDGCEIALPAAAAPALWTDLLGAGVRPCGLGARDTLRLEAGMNLYGNDMDASVTPLESGLAWTVDLRDARDFVGRAALEAQAAEPGLRQLLGLKLRERGVLRAHQDVATAHGAGQTTSGTFAPTLGCAIALARLPAGVMPGDEVSVDLRGRAAAAVVCRPPFVRHGKVLA